ncbi:pyridoxamine 5'-phosphate oxidase family protein [Micromonospora zhanjiangensis]
MLATTRADGRPHAAPTSLVRHDRAIWLPSVAGAVRLANLAVNPWASLVVMRGDGPEHVMALLEGPTTVVDAATDDAAAAARRYGREPSWATAWIRLTPRKILSYAGAEALLP